MLMAVPQRFGRMGGGRAARGSRLLRPLGWTAGLAVDVLLVYTILLAVLVFCATTVPALLGYQTMLVSSGSMAPTIQVGDAVVIHRTTADAVRPNDIVTYAAPRSPGVVTHRVLQVRDIDGRRWLQTKGDAAARPDPNLTPGEAVRGKVVLVLPRMGYILHLARTMWGGLLTIGLPLTVLIAREVLDLVRNRSEVAPARRNLSEPEPHGPPSPAHVVRATAPPGRDAGGGGAHRGERPHGGRAA